MKRDVDTLARVADDARRGHAPPPPIIEQPKPPAKKKDTKKETKKVGKKDVKKNVPAKKATPETLSAPREVKS